MTSNPFTLRAAAGLPTEARPIANSTLLIIDAQDEYVSGALALPDTEPATANIARILKAARDAGSPVIHIAHLGSAGGMFDPEGSGKIIDAVAPLETEPVILKNLPNAFAGTDLADQLKGFGDRPLLICGFMTHMCISATARAATDLGFDSTVVSDASATRSLPSAVGGEDVSAEQLHQSALAGLADRFAAVASTQEVLDA